MKKKSHDFLSDRKFLEWKFFDDEELNSYWKEYKEQNPEDIDELNLAEKSLKNYKLNAEKVSEPNREKTLNRILSSRDEWRKKRHKRLNFIRITAVACAFLAFTFLYFSKQQQGTSFEKNIAIGSILNSDSIILITSNETQTFSTDINLEVDDDGLFITDDDNEARIVTNEVSMNKLIVPYGRRSQMTLQDGTKVWVNSGSTVEFPSSFSGNERRIKLTGEIYIEVAPDSKRSFYVQTSDFDVKVYGTKFNVSADNRFENSVVLVEGSVSILTPEKETKILPSQKAVMNKNDINISRVNTDYYTTWKDGYLLLSKESIADILKYMERYYNLSFHFQQGIGLEKITCTGKLNLNEDMDNVMNAIAVLSNTRYTRENNIIYITNK